MARIYSNTRTLLDPSLLQMANNVVNERLIRDAERRAPIVSSIRDILKSTAGTISDWRNEIDREKAVSDREKTVSSWDLSNDPIANAAREEYIRTGNSNPLMNYQMQKLTAEQRVADAAKAAEEKAWQQKLHDAVNLREDRNKYAQYQTNMFKSMDENRLADAETFKKQMEGLEDFYKKYYPQYENPFGGTADSMWDARKKEKDLADTKRAQEEEDKHDLELGERNLKAIQDINEQERLYRVEQFLSTLPTAFKTDNDKPEVYNLINSNEDMTTSEKAENLKRVREIVSDETAEKKAVQVAGLNKAVQASLQAIDSAAQKRKLANAGRAALQNNRKPTREQQKAMDDGY